MDPIIVALVSALASFGGSWAAVKVKLRWLSSRLDGHDKRIERLEYPHFAPQTTRGHKG